MIFRYEKANVLSAFSLAENSERVHMQSAELYTKEIFDTISLTFILGHVPEANSEVSVW